MVKQAWVDQDECINDGLCVDNLPDVFRYAYNGKAECFDSSGAIEAEIENEGIDICLVSCIHWQK